MAPVSSPCVQLCTVDARSGLCRGCGRTLDEIAGWATMPEAARRALMARLSARIEAATRPDADPLPT